MVLLLHFCDTEEKRIRKRVVRTSELLVGNVLLKCCLRKQALNTLPESTY